MSGTKEKRVEVFVPKGFSGDDPNLFVSVNGVNFLLPRGKTSLVPAHIKKELERARLAQDAADANAAALANI